MTIDEFEKEFLRLSPGLPVDINKWTLQDAFEFGWMTRDSVDGLFFNSPDYQKWLLHKIPGGEDRLQKYILDHGG